MIPSRRASAGRISAPFISPCSPFFFCSAPCSAAAIAAWTRTNDAAGGARSRCCSSWTSFSRTTSRAASLSTLFSLDYLPLHLCSINIFLIVLHAWRRPKLLDTFLYFVCLAAACAALLFPTWAPLPPLNFMVIHSFTVHFLLALYPLALTLRGDMDPQPRAFPRCFALLAAMAVPIWFFNRAFGTNFMFLMRAGEGNPLKLFERFGSHLLGYPVLLAVVFAVMYLLLRVLRRRTAVPAGK